ncbi:MAG: heavy metal-binding domain-containing protein [Streptosporangiaceae bacterium]
MLIVTTDSLPGFEIRQVCGAVSGAGVQPPHAPGMSSGQFHSGQVSHGLSVARREAIERLKADAQRLGGNAVVGMRFDNGALAGGAHEVCAYGTAVRVESVTADGRPRQDSSSQPMPSTMPGQASGMPMGARNLTVSYER